MPTVKEKFALDTDASVVAISSVLLQNQEWNGRTLLRTIACGRNILSDTEKKHGTTKAEIFVVITFVKGFLE